MSPYVVLARKYRSQTFEEVIGQDPIAQTLVNAINSGRIAHAYLFTGTRGVGKTTVARILAKSLNCLRPDAPTPKPCNKCDACLAISRGDDIDVIEIDGASNRGIDEIRQLRSSAIFRPARSRFKVYYIDEVHMLTKEAFNALLKTLEEPPEHVKFIFSTTEVEKVPATIVSRCQRFDFRNIPTSLIADHLATICKKEKVKADKDALFRIARAGAGSMRDGLSLLDQLLSSGSKVNDDEVVHLLGVPSDERITAIVSAIADGDSAAALTELAGVLERGVTTGGVTAALGSTFRNMMIAATCGGESDLIELPQTQKKSIAELASRFSLPVLVQDVGICQSVATNVRGSSVARALLEAVVVRLSESEKFVDPQSLIERLEKLSGEGEKKKLIPAAGARSPATGEGSSQAYPQSGPSRARGGDVNERAAGSKICWEASWLKSNWTVVIDALFAAREARVGGCLRAGQVMGFEDDTLSLGFDARHESLFRRCSGPMNGAVHAALRGLAGREIRCRYVQMGQYAADYGAPPADALPLSTEEKRQIRKDPGVKEVLDLFGGEVVDVRKGEVPPLTNGNDGEDVNDD